MTIDQTTTDIGRTWSAGQLAGEACIHCGTSRPPLHPDGTITVPDPRPGVVHDYDVASCTGCLVVNR